MLNRLKKLFACVSVGGGYLLKEDGFFFVVLSILNLPIILLEEDLQVGAINFWLGAFGILIITVVMNFLPLKIRRLLQAALIILFAAICVADAFLLYKFGVPLNMDMLQILLGTNPLTAKTFLLEQVFSAKVIGGLAAFVILLTALSFGLKKFFATRSEKRLKLLAVDLLIIFFLPTIFLEDSGQWIENRKFFQASKFCSLFTVPYPLTILLIALTKA